MNRRLRKGFSLFLFYLYNRFAILFLKMDSERILFLTESHNSLDGNLKAMYEYLISRGKAPVYYTKADRRQVMGLKTFFSLMKDISISKYIFLDDFYGLTSAMKLREGQKIIQLWHGAGAFKKFGYSRKNTGDETKNIHSGYKKYTHVIVSSEAVRECYAEAFGISIDKVYATGIPRTDCFFDDGYMSGLRKSFYEKYPELVTKKIVLIAPTYRGDNVEKADYDFHSLELPNLISSLGDEYAVAVKWHRAITNNINNGMISFDLPKECYDFSMFEDINDILPVIDVLVTDYSSVIFDYVMLDKPIVYFTYDLDKYKESRGLYFNFNDYVFGTISLNSQSIVEAIKEGNMCNAKRRNFVERFVKSCDGKARERIYKLLFEKKDM